MTAPPRFLDRDYRDPHTRLGQDLTALPGGEASSFLVHECGFRYYENWNHRGILSPYWRLHYNFESGNAIRSEGIEHSLSPDRSILIPAGVPLDTLGRRTVPHLWIHFLPSPEFMLAMKRPVPIGIDDALGQALKGLRSFFEDAQEVSTRRMKQVCMAVLHLAFAQLGDEWFRAYPDRLVHLLRHIEAHLGDPLSTAELVRLSGMSRHRLTELFQRHTSLSPSRYVADLRIRTAMQHLASTDASIEQIAEELGFPNRYYFSRVFKRRMGCGPATFRRGQR